MKSINKGVKKFDFSAYRAAFTFFLYIFYGLCGSSIILTQFTLKRTKYTNKLSNVQLTLGSLSPHTCKHEHKQTSKHKAVDFFFSVEDNDSNESILFVWFVLMSSASVLGLGGRPMCC